MKKGKRIAAFALSLVVALGSVCYRSPKAEAVVFESAALVSALTSTYLSSTGFSFSASTDNWDADAVNERIYNETKQFFVDVYSAYVETEEEFYALLCDGAEILTDGVVKFSAAAANLLGQFSDWLVEKFGLIGEDGAPVTDSVPIVPGTGGYFSYNGIYLPALPVWDSITYPYVYVEDSSGAHTNYVAYFSDRKIFVDASSSSNSYYSSKDGVSTFFTSTYNASIGEWGDFGNTFTLSANRYNGLGDYVIWSNFDIMKGSAIYLAASEPVVAEDWENPVLSVTLPADYEAAPTVDEQYAMVIDTGLTFADEQSYIDAILGGVAAGTLSPTYTVEETTAGDVTVPGEDAEDDTQVGILNWVKKIWQSVKELPQTIADAVANVFVPSEEYMATVPETIADTFGSRTGFLTYPTSVLYDFVDMLSETSGDFILSWPTVREPSTGGVMMEAGQFNVSKFVRDNQSLSDWYIIYRYAVGAYLTFLFFGLCRRKYNSVVGDRLGV